MLYIVKEQKGLFVHKYKNKVFYDNLWTQELCDKRGTVYDADGSLVSYPFTKIFNYGENGTTIPLDHIVTAFRKVNGFMACASLYRGEVLVSTTGSLESAFVDMATEMLPMELLKQRMLKDYSYCFEIAHPNDPHIIKEEPGVYAIGCRKNVIGSEQDVDELTIVARACNLWVPVSKTCSFQELLLDIKTNKTEGWVVYDTESSVVLKLKTPYYLISKFIARKKDLGLIFSKGFKQYVDEEFYPLYEYLQSEFTLKEFSAFNEKLRLEIIQQFLSY